MNQELIKYCVEKGLLLDKEMLELLSQVEESLAENLIDRINLFCQEKVITKACLNRNHERIEEIFSDFGGDKKTIDRLLINLGLQIEITKEKIEKIEKKQEPRETEDFKILESYSEKSRKLTVEDFVKHFKNRFNFLKNVLRERQDLQNLTSINKISGNRQGISIIGLVRDKRITKNKNILLELEDLTGRIAVLVNHNKEEVYEKAQNVLLDDTIGIKCSGNREIVFVNDLVYPDSFIPEKKRNKKEELVAFTSDIHLGSENFLEKNFDKFLSWLNGKYGGDEWKKVKYLFITGDNVDGVGIFPGQENFLTIKDMKEQYVALAEKLKRIRKDIKIILCPGQHDAVRVAEPQPSLDRTYASPLHELENLYLVSNPALVEIGDAGFKVLMYHGASMRYFVEGIEYLRMNAGMSTPAKIGKEMLKRRHLAPIHSSVLYIPSEDKDSLVIDVIPDILTTGDLHKSDVDLYNNILIVASSCWQSTTPFEEKVGNHPIPCKVPLLNLKTREIKILDFADEEEKEEEKKEIEGEEEG